VFYVPNSTFIGFQETEMLTKLLSSRVVQTVLAVVLVAEIYATPTQSVVEPFHLQRHEAPIERTYLFSNFNWWESADHQMTTAITLLSLAFNISAISVLPDIAGPQGGPRSRYSLLSDFYDVDKLRAAQDFMSILDFVGRDDYNMLKTIAASDKGLTFPKASQEKFEEKLNVLSSIGEGTVSFGMPHEDTENMDIFCSSMPGTVHHTLDGRVRFIFLDHVHFYHFCAERFMPWWYDVRMHIVPRREYRELAQQFAATVPKPLTVVHVRDLMDHQKERDQKDIEEYARQIADAMRRSGKESGGSLYLSYSMNGRSVRQVAGLLKDEFSVVKNCLDLYVCGRVVSAGTFKPPLDSELHQVLFGTHVGASLVEVALSMQADHFVGNVFSPYSRNVALYRKLQGGTYDILKGFGELKKVYRWHL
jgi:hypothetical protein